MIRIRYFLVLMIGMGWILVGCSTPPTTPPPPSTPAQSLLTAAAQTAIARLTETLPVPPGAALPTATVPLIATETLPGGTPTPESAATPVASTTFTPLPATQPPGATNQGVFVKDVNVPDNTAFNPGASFTKTWQFMNTGTSTWTSAYEFVFVSGDAMNAAASVTLPYDVAPSQAVDISVNMTAPQTAGTFKGFWRLRSPGGEFFGDLVYVQIVVGEGSAATATPGAGGLSITNLSLGVDNAAYTGACPHKFIFSASFTTNVAASLTYQLEVGGFDNVVAPPARTETLGSGSYTFTYEVEISTTGSGWARLHFTAPVDVASSDTTFSLTCQP